ncbi:MAG: hypothetical protein HYX52_05665 [Chloroflexi bacterium]|nr:hypothetical protein [Chloroflexota bacterium]
MRDSSNRESLTDHELLVYVARRMATLDKRLDKIDGHIAVLNDEHNHMVAWRAKTDRLLGHLQGRVTLAAFLTGAAGLIAVLTKLAELIGAGG